KYAKPLRLFLKKHITKLLNFKEELLFENVSVHTSILISEKNSTSRKIPFFEFQKGTTLNQANLEEPLKSITLNRNDLGDDWVIAEGKDKSVIDKLEAYCPLGDISIIEQGSKSGKNSVFTISEELVKNREIEKNLLRKNIKNGDIDRYHFTDRNQYLIYLDNDADPKKYPNLYKYLLEHKEVLSNRNEVKRGIYKWFRLDRPRKKHIFDAQEKLIVPYRATRNRFSYDNRQYFNDGGDIRVIVLNDKTDLNIKYVLAILNTTLINWYYGFIGKPKGDSREYFNEPLGKIPIKEIDFSNQSEKATHDQIVKLVDNLLKLNKELQKTKLETQRNQLQRAIDHSERKIDELVYGLYGLSEEEIKIVEGKCG
ncbi:hypothetical protein JYT51_00955, partial [Candidatus Amoebophilus asiaticus]|nr:hypothetical protein [Candidatus Amoebophilus asiaticus]